MTEARRPGWLEHVAGPTRGKVVKKLTHETKIGGHVAKPTKDDPQYLVESEETGATAAHKPDALKKA